MRQFKTNNIVIEMNEEELALIMSALNSAEIRRREQGQFALADTFQEMWIELYNIRHELDE